MSELHRVAGKNDVTPGQAITVEVIGQRVALFNVEGTFYAIHGTCTHVGGPLGEGTLDGEIVTCPWHGAQFNVTTGEVLRRPAGNDERSFPVRIEGSDVLVELD